MSGFPLNSSLNDTIKNNIDTIVDCAALSRGIYLDGPDFKDWAISQGYEDVEVHTHEQLQIGLCKKGKNIFIACRGTVPSNFGNLLQDADIRHAPDPRESVAHNGGTVHNGFSSALNELKYGGTRVLDSLLYTKAKEYIEKYPACTINATGHSLGAAMSTEILRRLERDGIPAERIASFTFGEPKGENRVAAEATNKFCADGIRIRVVNKGDPVTIVPPVGYTHSGASLKIEGKGQYSLTPCGTEMAQPATRTRGPQRSAPTAVRGFFPAMSQGHQNAGREEEKAKLVKDIEEQLHKEEPTAENVQITAAAEMLADAYIEQIPGKNKTSDGHHTRAAFTILVGGTALAVGAAAILARLFKPHSMEGYYNEMVAIQHAIKNPPKRAVRGGPSAAVREHTTDETTPHLTAEKDIFAEYEEKLRKKEAAIFAETTKAAETAENTEQPPPPGMRR